jgi:hypothetical protein
MHQYQEIRRSYVGNNEFRAETIQIREDKPFLDLNTFCPPAAMTILVTKNNDNAIFNLFNVDICVRTGSNVECQMGFVQVEVSNLTLLAAAASGLLLTPPPAVDYEITTVEGVAAMRDTFKDITAEHGRVQRHR